MSSLGITILIQLHMILMILVIFISSNFQLAKMFLFYSIYQVNNMANDLRLHEIQTLKVNITSSLDVSTDQKYFTIVTRQRAKKSSMFDYQIELYDLHNMQKLSSRYIYSTYKVHKHHCQILKANNLIVVAAKDHIIFYNQKLQQVFKVLHQQQNVYGLASSPNGQMIAMVGDNKVLIWDTLTFETINFPYQILMARNCQFSYDNRYIGVSTTTILGVYQIIPSPAGYVFQTKAYTPEEVSYGLISSFSFNPHDSNVVVIGFSNMSPKVYDFSQEFLGYQTLFENGEQPTYFNNYKIVTYLPDGKRIASSDYLEGVGLWPGEPSGNLIYRQNYLFFDVQSFDKGRKLIGYVWQQIKIMEIQFKCPQKTYEHVTQKSQQFKTSCRCTNSFQYWNPYKYACENCMQNGKNICECPQGQKFIAYVGKCVTECSQIPHAIPDTPILSAEPQKCLCERGYFWVNGSCIFDCNEIQFALSQSAQGQCTCLFPFKWNVKKKICQCPQYSKFDPMSPSFCECDEFHYLDLETMECFPDCTRIPFTNISNITQAVDPLSCPCISGYSFKQYDLPGSGHKTQGCLKNCGLINNTVDGTFDISSCKCVENTKWMNQICQISCSSIPNAISQIVDNENGEIAGCRCALNYIWIQQNKQCGRNCQDVKYVNQSEYSTAIACPCKHNFNWNQYTNQCILDCDHIQFAQKFVASGKADTCVCRQNFLWDKDQISCLINCTEIWDAKKERISAGICQCNGNKNFNQSSLTCQAVMDERVFSQPWVWGVLIASLIFVIIVGVMMVKFCCRFGNQKPNKEHEKKLKKTMEPRKKRKKPKQKINLDVNTERIGLT